MPAGFDVAVVGGGPGGYVAAIRAAQLGARTAIIEKDRLGGTCLVRGCIPTKALLQSSELYSMVGRGAQFGVVTEGLRFDLSAAQKRGVEVVDALVKGVEGLMKANGIAVFSGHGVLRKGGKVAVGDEVVSAKDIVIATGSAPSTIPIPGVEHTIDSDGILELPEVPERLAVIGGGVVGMEWGALYAALGTEVIVLEMLPQILSMVESDMVALYRRHFEKIGGRIVTEAKVEGVGRAKGGLSVRYSAGGEHQSACADVVLLATGRAPYTHKLGLDTIGVERVGGRIVVDDHLRTAAAGVWAIGDVIGGIMLAHVAAYEGVCAVENIAGGHGLRKPDYHAAPNCIYTDPEIANVGLGESEARERGMEVNVGRFPFAASGRAMTLGATEGAVKVVSDARDGTILGVQMVGAHVSDVIAEATLAVQHRLKVEDLHLTMHAHPTMAESLLEAALAAEGRAIHIANRRRPAAAAVSDSRPQARAAVPTRNGSSSNTQEEASAERPAALTEAASAARNRRGPARPATPARRALVIDDPARLEMNKASRGTLLELLRLMYLIRRFEERAQVEYTRANIGGYCHLNLGEEASVVGGILPLKPTDWIYTSYREHGHAIARGVDPRSVMAELFGKETGTSHGRGGSMHIFDYAHRFMGGYGIVGGHLPLATGAAFSVKYRKADDVVFCMFGDGATNIGAFHESLNFSKVRKLPVVWYCINNQYGMGTPNDRASAVSELYKRACAYDMESIRVDGMDVLEVLRKTAEVLEKTRRDSEPRFIEAFTYRFKGHSVVDPDKYRSDTERARWRKDDPIVHFEVRLEEAGIAGEKDFKAIRNQVETQIEEIVKFAADSPDPKPGELFRYLYADDRESVSNA